MKYRRELKIKTDSLTFAGKEWGNISADRVLALHGWLDNAASFDSLAELLPDLHFIALDFPGHGFSDHRPPGVNYHFVDYVKDVISVVTELRWDKFSLLGHSLGAAVASIVAGTFPDLISKLILIEGLGPMIRDANDSPDYLSKSIRQTLSPSLQKSPEYNDLEKLIKVRSKIGDLTEESAALLLKRSLKKNGKGWTWRSDRRLTCFSPLYLTNEQVNSFLRRIQAPTFLITGKSGRLTDSAYLKKRCSLVKNITISSLEGGHHTHMDNPAMTAQVISDFICS